MKIIIFTLIFFQPLTLMGQRLDVETEKFPGVKKMTVRFYGSRYFKKSSRIVYYFDSNGNAIKSSDFDGIKCVARHLYLYNEKGLLSEEIQTYDVDDKKATHTTKWMYEFDTNDRLIRKAIVFGNGKWEADIYYQDFDENNNPQTVISDNRTTIEYNSLGKAILIRRFKNEEIQSIEEIRYNEFGDKIYSRLPLYDIKKPETWVSGRYSAIEIYEYKYDKSNRWIEKYIVYDNKKKLLQKRGFK